MGTTLQETPSGNRLHIVCISVYLEKQTAESPLLSMHFPGSLSPSWQT